MAGCDSASVLQPIEHILDPAAAAIVPLVATDGFAARLPAQDAAAYPFVFQRISEPVGVITPVRDHLLGSLKS